MMRQTGQHNLGGSSPGASQESLCLQRDNEGGRFESGGALKKGANPERWRSYSKSREAGHF